MQFCRKKSTEVDFCLYLCKLKTEWNMLRKFSVSNFKCFKDKFEFDLSSAKNYTFNTDCVKNGIVNCSIVYGYNGSGKSNLGLAIFDIIEHLTDNNR